MEKSARQHLDEIQADVNQAKALIRRRARNQSKAAKEKAYIALIVNQFKNSMGIK